MVPSKCTPLPNLLGWLYRSQKETTYFRNVVLLLDRCAGKTKAGRKQHITFCRFNGLPPALPNESTGLAGATTGSHVDVHLAKPFCVFPFFQVHVASSMKQTCARTVHGPDASSSTPTRRGPIESNQIWGVELADGAARKNQAFSASLCTSHDMPLGPVE